MVNQNIALVDEQSDEERFGPLRDPQGKPREWETGVKPKSLTILTKEMGEKLRSYRELAQSSLFWNVAQCSSFLWAMSDGGDVMIAYEEIVVDLDIADHPELKEGYPRRRGYPTHPATEKKLGHPTLVGGGKARIAGELFLDVKDEKLHWFVNCNSGRYCREISVRPTQANCAAVEALFR